MSGDMSPQKKSQPMERVDVRLPSTMLETIDQLASVGGVDRPEIIRQAIGRGLPHLLQDDQVRVEYEIKGLVKAKLERRSSDIVQAIADLEKRPGNEAAISLLKSVISA